MFHSITALKQEVVDGQLRVTFSIKDTCFSQEIEINGARMDYGFFEPIALFNTYVSRNLNVARNLAIYYITLDAGNRYLKEDKLIIDRHFPSLRYGEKYFNSVYRYYKDLRQLIIKYDKQKKMEATLAQMLKQFKQ